MTTLSKLNRLRGAEFAELHTRFQQALASFVERRGWSSETKVPTDQALFRLLAPSPPNCAALLDRFFTRQSPKVFAGLADRDATIREINSRWPEARSAIVQSAERVLQGEFDLLGYRQLDFGNPIDWHLDPTTGKRSPLVHWSLVDELDADASGDPKIARELSRHQYFIKLGQAYWLTADERYAEAFVAHLTSWMDQNPPKMGTHWGSSLEIAFRSISWIWAFYLFKGSRALTPEVFARSLKFLYLKARHLQSFLSTYFSPNTHLTGEALGLFYLGTFLPELKDAKGWKRIGRKILLEQLPRHVLGDGVYFEQSSYYHRYTIDFYIHFLILSRLNDEVLPDAVELKIQALLDHVMYISRPDGTTPLIGDDDGGRLIFLDRSDPNNFGAALSTGAAVFARPDYKFVAQGVREETLWLLGAQGLRHLDELQPQEPVNGSVAFKYGGYYVMRDGWTSDANYLLFDCGPHGTLNCGHAHADALSFELVAGGRTLLVDPGTFTYTGSKSLRDWFRSSHAHNTLTIDGESSSVPAGPFSWTSIAQSQCLNWISRPRFDFVAGRHQGYQRLAEPVDHTRSVLFLKNDYWILRDYVVGSGNHTADLWFHFDSAASPKIDADEQGFSVRTGNQSENDLAIAVFAHEGERKEESGWVSHCYGSKERAPICVFSTAVKGEARLTTFLLPNRSDISPSFTVREVEAIGGSGFELAHTNGLDVLMIPEKVGQVVETERLASDFAWTWARFTSIDEPMPTEFVLLNGTTLQLEGREILKSSKPIEYLAAKREGDHFKVETNEGILNIILPVGDFATAFSRLSGLEVRD